MIIRQTYKHKNLLTEWLVNDQLSKKHLDIIDPTTQLTHVCVSSIFTFCVISHNWYNGYFLNISNFLYKSIWVSFYDIINIFQIKSMIINRLVIQKFEEVFFKVKLLHILHERLTISLTYWISLFLLQKNRKIYLIKAMKFSMLSNLIIEKLHLKRLLSKNDPQSCL